MKILLSIKPEFAEKIFNGEKRFEFRKRVPKYSGQLTYVVYVSRPVQKIVGEFDVSEVVTGDPESVWCQTSQYSGISKTFFDEYFQEKSTAFALKVSNVREFSEAIEPNSLIDNFTPPQSYMFIDDDLGRLQPQQLSLV